MKVSITIFFFTFDIYIFIYYYRIWKLYTSTKKNSFSYNLNYSGIGTMIIKHAEMKNHCHFILIQV